MVGPLVTPKQIEKTTSSQSVASDFIGFNLFGMVISKSVLNRPATNLSSPRPSLMDFMLAQLASAANSSLTVAG